ncbi:MAG: hypothetical protein ISP71_03865 [Flavobacteriales bacterium]|nr:hypothetical protein [Flavobacteriales bacterium]
MKKLFITFFSLVISFGSYAQSQYSLSFAGNDIISVDTAEFSELIPLNFTLINTGTDTIFGMIPIYYSVNASNVSENEFPNVSALFDIVFSEATPFAPGDSFDFNSEDFDILLDELFIDVSEERNFNVGDNIIIVWPALSSDLINNSTFTTEQYVKEIYVLEPLSVKAPKQIDFRLFVEQQNIRIESLKALEEICIYGLNGQLLYRGTENTISGHHFPTGVYVFRIRFEGGEIQTGRVFLPN